MSDKNFQVKNGLSVGSISSNPNQVVKVNTDGSIGSAALKTYNYGDTGPGGGVVFYYDPATSLFSEMYADVSVLSTQGNYTWADAQAYCAAFNQNGYTDWRLPNLAEAFAALGGDTAVGTYANYGMGVFGSGYGYFPNNSWDSSGWTSVVNPNDPTQVIRWDTYEGMYSTGLDWTNIQTWIDHYLYGDPTEGDYTATAIPVRSFLGLPGRGITAPVNTYWQGPLSASSYGGPLGQFIGGAGINSSVASYIGNVDPTGASTNLQEYITFLGEGGMRIDAPQNLNINGTVSVNGGLSTNSRFDSGDAYVNGTVHLSNGKLVSGVYQTYTNDGDSFQIAGSYASTGTETTVRMSQGSKSRISKFLIISNDVATSCSYTEIGVVVIGGTINHTIATGTDGSLSIVLTDAGTTAVNVSMIQTIL